jgi:hypothetical protein
MTEEEKATLEAEEAELQKEREARKKAEEKLATDAYKFREKKRENQVQEVEEADDDKPLTAKQLQALLAKEREATRKELQDREAGRIVADLSVNATEQQLTLEIWKNRSFPEHLSLQDQLEESYAIANRKKLISERNEALRALKGKQGANTDASGTHQEAPQAGQPKMAAADASELARLGFKWNGANRRYEKKLSNGKTLVHDQKAKRNYLV